MAHHGFAVALEAHGQGATQDFALFLDLGFFNLFVIINQVLLVRLLLDMAFVVIVRQLISRGVLVAEILINRPQIGL
jgi:hypothetical protein